MPILLKQDLKGGYEIIVVDSGSTDGAREYIKTLPVKLVEIHPRVFNYANAFNAGAKLAKGEFLVRLSGDAIPVRNNFLKEITAPFSEDKVGGVYGKYTVTGREGYQYPGFWPASEFPDKTFRISIVPNPFKMLFCQKHRHKVLRLAGACCAIRRETWEQKPFNENLVAAEDGEYAWFLHLSGYDIVYVPGALVIHEHPVTPINYKTIISGLSSEIAWRRSLYSQIGGYYLKHIRVKNS